MPPVPPVSMLRRIMAGAAIVAVSMSGAAVAVTPATEAALSSRPSIVIDGPDVASYQHPNGAKIAWQKVAAAHKDFAIVKATEGTFYRNPWFRSDYLGAGKAGLARGSYHFARPAFPIVETARAQASYYLRMLGNSPRTARTLPPALDLEVTGGLAPAALVLWAQSFLLEVRRQTGRTPMIYTYPYFWTSALGDPTALARYPLWMASYSSPVTADATLWQYTSRARVAGIPGTVDMSRLVDDPAAWYVLSDGRIATPWPAKQPGAPQQVDASPLDRAATVRWMPGDTGSGDVRSYTVTALPGGQHVTVDGSTFAATVPALTNGTPYTFTVAAANGHGAGVPSTPTDAVVPLVPTALTVHAPAYTTYGTAATVSVRLTRPDRGAALSDRTVTVEQRQPGAAAWQPWKTLVTSAHGWVSVRFSRPSFSRELRFTYAGPTGWRAARAVVPVVVRNGVSATLSKKRVRVGHPVVMTGRTAPALAGITVWRQGYYGGRWHTLGSTTTQEGGSYTFAFTPSVKAVNHYRVVVAAFGGRSRGYSPILELRVR